MERPQTKDWMWISVLLKPGLVECVMEADLSYDHLYGLEPLPERVRMRRLIFVQSLDTPQGKKVTLQKPTSIAGADNIGSMKTESFFLISEVDPMILKNVKDMYGMKSIETDLSSVPDNLRGRRS